MDRDYTRPRKCRHLCASQIEISPLEAGRWYAAEYVGEQTLDEQARIYYPPKEHEEEDDDEQVANIPGLPVQVQPRTKSIDLCSKPRTMLLLPIYAVIGSPRARPLPGAAAAPRPQSAHLCRASCSKGGWNRPVPPNSSELGRSPQGKR